jgi:hypothetical protein
MQSVDSLRKLNAKLLAKIAKLRKENAVLKDKNAEIPDLKKKFAKIEFKKVELKARVAKLLRQAVKESKRRDVENAKLRARIEELKKNKTVIIKLESENAEFRDKITKVEQRQMQNDNVTKETNSSNNSSSNFNLLTDEFPMEMDTSLPEELIPEGLPEPTVNIPVIDQCNQTSLEDKKIDACSAFILEQYKKSISEEIRQKRRKEKLQCESEVSKKSENAKLKGSQGDQARVVKLEQDSSVVDTRFHPKQPQDIEDDVAPKISDLG